MFFRAALKKTREADGLFSRAEKSSRPDIEEREKSSFPGRLLVDRVSFTRRITQPTYVVRMVEFYDVSFFEIEARLSRESGARAREKGIRAYKLAERRKRGSFYYIVTVRRRRPYGFLIDKTATRTSRFTAVPPKL